MNCRNWPPFYEQNVDGKCVSTPPIIKNSPTYDYLGFALVLLVVAIPIIIISKSK